MARIRLPLAALTLFLVVACQSAAPTATMAPRQPAASTVVGSDSLTAAERGGNLFGSGN